MLFTGDQHLLLLMLVLEVFFEMFLVELPGTHLQHIARKMS